MRNYDQKVLNDILNECPNKVGFLIEAHPTLRSPNRAILPHTHFRAVEYLSFDDVNKFLKDIDCDISYLRERKDIETSEDLLISALERFEFSKYIFSKPERLDYFNQPDIDYFTGIVYEHIDIGIIYSNDYFSVSEERIREELKDFREFNFSLNDLYNYFSDKAFWAIPVMEILETVEVTKNEQPYEFYIKAREVERFKIQLLENDFVLSPIYHIGDYPKEEFKRRSIECQI